MQNYGAIGTSIDTFFDSFNEFLDVASDLPLSEEIVGLDLMDEVINRRPDSASRRVETKYWEGQETLKLYRSGAKTFEDALKMAREDWPDGREFMEHHKMVIDNLMTGVRFKEEYQYSVAGSGVLDVTRHIIGLPDPFIVDHESDTPVNARGSSIVRILFNGTTVWNVSPKQMMTKGALITSLVELLELNHRRCEVYFGVCIGGNTGRIKKPLKDVEDARHAMAYIQNNAFHRIWVPVKAPGQALHPEAMFFALGCPAMLRRFIFSIQERFIEPIRHTFNYHLNYGAVSEFGSEDVVDWDIVIPSTSRYDSETAWRKFLLASLKSQGIEMID